MTGSADVLPEADPPSTAGLRFQAVGSAAWIGASTLVRTVLQVATTLVLARLLAPSDFGLMAMATVAFGFVQQFTDVGISSALIHRQESSSDRLSSLYWFAVGLSALLGLAVAGSSYPASLFFGEPRLVPLLAWMSPLLVVAALGQQFQVLLEKELRFALVAGVETASAVLNSVAAVAAAAAGLGVYSFVLGLAVGIAARTAGVGAWGLRHHRPRLRFRRADLEGYVGFGLFQMSERIVNFFAFQADRILIGHHLGPSALGLYNLAYQVVLFPVMQLNPIITRVMLPVFARLQRSPSVVAGAYQDVLRGISLLNFPFLFGIAAVAAPFVQVVLGAQWAAAAPLLVILAWAGVIRVVANPVGALWLSRGFVRLGFLWSVLTAGTSLLVLAVAVPHGLVAAAASYAALITALFAFFVLFRLGVRPLKTRQLLQPLAPAAGLAGLMALLAAGVAWTLDGAGPSVALAAAVSSGAAFYVVAVTAVERTFVRHLWESLRGPKRQASSPRL